MNFATAYRPEDGTGAKLVTGVQLMLLCEYTSCIMQAFVFVFVFVFDFNLSSSCRLPNKFILISPPFAVIGKAH